MPRSIVASLLLLLLLPPAFSAATDAKGAAAAVTRYESRHGFSLEVPAGWRVEPYLDEADVVLEKGLEGSGLLHIYSYDHTAVENPGEPVRADQIKIEGLFCRPAYKSVDAWLAAIPKVTESRPFATGAGEGRLVVNTETDMESGHDYTLRRVILITPSLQVQFHHYPPDSRHAAAFERLAASLKLK